MNRRAVDLDLLREVEQFLFYEARLVDEHEYEAWEALWTDDALYWVPAMSDDIDPQTRISIVHDNRSRIRTRVRQLLTGRRHSQAPPSRLRRLLSNIEVLGAQDGDLLAGANFLVVESRDRGPTLWAGRAEYRLRRTPEGWRMARKKVMLVDNDRPLWTMAFLL